MRSETEKLLRELHTMLAETLHRYMIETPIDKRRASMLDVIRKFLQDNGVEHSDELQALEALSRSRDHQALEALDTPF